MATVVGVASGVAAASALAVGAAEAVGAPVGAAGLLGPEAVVGGDLDSVIEPGCRLVDRQPTLMYNRARLEPPPITGGELHILNSQWCF